MPKKQPKSVFARLVEADKKQGPLKLKPGDVMQLMNFFAEAGCERESQFLALSAYGYQKRFGDPDSPKE